MTDESKTIVIVEDEVDTAEMFAEMMRLKNYQVFKSHGGTRAIALIAEKMPDAVILDVMMPGLSGYEVLKYMHLDPRLADIPVVIVSAKGMPSDIKNGLDAGASFYLTKPVTFQDLARTIETAIQKQA
jgi:CheY-like chemotaxis protein